MGASSDDVVLFTGTGATGAIDKLIGVLGLKLPTHSLGDSPARPTLAQHLPVVFVGPYEHHSNEVSWRMSAADVVVVPEDAAGRIDIQSLESALVSSCGPKTAGARRKDDEVRLTVNAPGFGLAAAPD